MGWSKIAGLYYGLTVADLVVLGFGLFALARGGPAFDLLAIGIAGLPGSLWLAARAKRRAADGTPDPTNVYEWIRRF